MFDARHGAVADGEEDGAEDGLPSDPVADADEGAGLGVGAGPRVADVCVTVVGPISKEQSSFKMALDVDCERSFILDAIMRDQSLNPKDVCVDFFGCPSSAHDLRATPSHPGSGDFFVPFDARAKLRDLLSANRQDPSHPRKRRYEILLTCLSCASHPRRQVRTQRVGTQLLTLSAAA